MNIQNKEDQFTVKRLIDLANLAYNRDIPVFSDFLDINEQSIFYSLHKELPPVNYILMGGHPMSERQLACFSPENINYTIVPPISTIIVKPLNAKFSDSLSHRDYLGSILNLGILRCKIGDIIVEEQCGYIFCIDSIADFIMQNLTRIKHTAVICSLCDANDLELSPELKEQLGSVASERLDAVIAFAYNLSRNSAFELIVAGRVFVNSKCTENCGHILHLGDLISVKGMGRFNYCGASSTTKKGRLYIKIEKYI